MVKSVPRGRYQGSLARRSWTRVWYPLVIAGLIYFSFRSTGHASEKPGQTSTSGTDLYNPSLSLRDVEVFGDLIQKPADYAERVTLITVYGNGTQAAYLPLLFQTAAQNKDDIDFLFVNIDQGGGCIDLSYATDPKSPTYSSNIKHLCLTERENDEYYMRWICTGIAGGCNREVEESILAELGRLHQEVKIGDEIFNTFKPWRGLVYKEHVKTAWWAWFDGDQVIGKWHLFPKDIMNNFDLIITGFHGSGHNALNMAGQCTLFKNNDKMARVPFRYKAIATVDGLSLLRPGDHVNILDEGLYGDLYLNRWSEVDVLRVMDLMGPDPMHGDRRLILADGHILNAHRRLQRADIQSYFNKINDPDTREYRVGRTLTPYGKTFAVNVSHEVVFWCNEDKWNPANNCPDFYRSNTMRQFIYRKNGKKWKIRRDVKLHVTHEWAFNAAQPAMYAHWLIWKRGVKHFQLPDWKQSGYLAERMRDGSTQRQNMLESPNSDITVVELSKDYYGTWTMKVGAEDPPRGFDQTFKMNEPFKTQDDDYYKYHTFEQDYEIQKPPRPTSGTGGWHHGNMDVLGEEPDDL